MVLLNHKLLRDIDTLVKLHIRQIVYYLALSVRI